MDVLPELSEAKLSDLLLSTRISLLPLHEQMRAIESEFNAPILPGQEALTRTVAPGRGRHLATGHFLLAHRNHVPMIAGSSHDKLATCFSFHQPNATIQEIGMVHQSDALYGGCGVSVQQAASSSRARQPLSAAQLSPSFCSVVLLLCRAAGW